MARTFQRRSPMSAISEINVTPLIDLAFALLIIFMITAPLLEQKIELQLPTETAKPQPRPSNQPVQVIAVNAEGAFFWGDEAVDPIELEARIASLARDAEPPLVRVRGDARVPYQSVVTVLDLLKKHEIRQLALDTRVE